MWLAIVFIEGSEIRRAPVRCWTPLCVLWTSSCVEKVGGTRARVILALLFPLRSWCTIQAKRVSADKSQANVKCSLNLLSRSLPSERNRTLSGSAVSEWMVIPSVPFQCTLLALPLLRVGARFFLQFFFNTSTSCNRLLAKFSSLFV